MMEKYKTIEQDIEQVTNQEVVRQFRISGIGVILLVLAAGCAIGGLAFEDPNSSVPTFLFTVSAFLLIAGVIKLCVHRHCYFFRPTKSRLKPVTLYFDIHEGDALRTCIEMKRFEELKQLKREKDSGIKLEAMVAGDQKFAVVQISEYVPYAYEAVTPVLCYYGEDARRLACHF